MAGVPVQDIANYLSTTEGGVIVAHYGHHHPDRQAGVGEAISSGAAGRVRKSPALKPKAKGPHPAAAAETRAAIRDMMEIGDAPAVAYAVVDETPNTRLAVLRAKAKQAVRSGDWAEVLGLAEAA